MNKMNLNKKNLIIYGICGVVLFIVVSCAVIISNMGKNIGKEKAEIAKVNEDASSISTVEESISKHDTTESASSEIGKTIEQVEEEIAKKTKDDNNKGSINDVKENNI